MGVDFSGGRKGRLPTLSTRLQKGNARLKNILALSRQAKESTKLIKTGAKPQVAGTGRCMGLFPPGSGRLEPNLLLPLPSPQVADVPPKLLALRADGCEPFVQVPCMVTKTVLGY